MIKFGDGMISMWVKHMESLVSHNIFKKNLKSWLKRPIYNIVRNKKESGGKMDIRQINGNELHGTRTGDGWEKCTTPISNGEVWTTKLDYDADAPEHCQDCRDPFGKRVIGRLDDRQYAECVSCRALYVRPIHDGLVMISLEEQIA